MEEIIFEPETCGPSGDEHVLKLHAVADGLVNTAPVSGLTHQFYRYPARFSPPFARAVIQAFTEPGDLVLDPFMGGGTAIVEALAIGRRAVGVDLNPIAVFVTRSKTTPLSKNDVRELRAWVSHLPKQINLHKHHSPHDDWLTYQRNVPWRIRKMLGMALDSALLLPRRSQRQFARAILLKTGQWALDGRRSIPSKTEFLNRLSEHSDHMLSGMDQFKAQVSAAFHRPALHAASENRRLLNRSAADFVGDKRLPSGWFPPKLVLMSPPYRGIHILYHRWQVQGRRETPAPFWIAGSEDGRGPSYYTFGDRHRRDDTVYLQFTEACFREIASVMDESTIVVQLVGFGNPEAQMKPYLKVLEEVGLEEYPLPPSLVTEFAAPRLVPNRKWYATSPSHAREYLLIHRKAR